MTPNVVYILPDKMGGVFNINAALIARRAGGDMPQHAVLTRNLLESDSRFGGLLDTDSLATVEYALPLENLHAVIDRLWRRVPQGPGVLVANDLIELAMLHVHDPDRAVVQIVHGDYEYYYALAERHQAVVDVFVTCSRTIFERLKGRLPQRARDVYYLPYAIELPVGRREPHGGPLRLLFLGRLDFAKGVGDLAAIDALLRARRITAQWTIVGAGPDGQKVRDGWISSAHVEWLGQLSSAETLRRMPHFDVIVLPTRAEGVPLVLVEAMAAGVVPVVSSLPSIAELVTHDTSGQLVTAGDIAGFAAAIERLDRDRELLDRLSASARAAVIGQFDIATRVAEYRRLFSRWQGLRRPRPERLPLPYGSRLDRRWLPNPAVRAVRATLRRISQH